MPGEHVSNALAVTLTVEELRALVRDAVRDEMRAIVDPADTSAPVTDVELAEARKRWARKLAGRR